jgi:hypothetical protein
MGINSEAERIQGLIVLLATCQTVVARLDSDDIDDRRLTLRINELSEMLRDELALGQDGVTRESFP